MDGSSPSTHSARTGPIGKNEDLEDDYMSMTFEDPTKSTQQKESSFQKLARKKREAEARAHPKSKAEKAAAEAAARDAALATSLDESNKGFRMMAKLGFKKGEALGKGSDEARTEPIGVEIRAGRGGIGLDAERKRKFREQADSEMKRAKVNADDYRERMRQEREVVRLDGQLKGAMTVAETLAEEERESIANDHETTDKASKPQVNLLWRQLVKQRQDKERAERARQELNQSESRITTYDDPDEDSFDKQALGEDENCFEDEDPELDEFLSLSVMSRLAKLVEYMREKHHYCFWCKTKYPDENLDGCPGVTESDHD